MEHTKNTADSVDLSPCAFANVTLNNRVTSWQQVA